MKRSLACFGYAAVALAVVVSALAGCAAKPTEIVRDDYTPPEPVPSTAPLSSPRQYSAPWFALPPAIDGNADAAWDQAEWTEDFVDIEGPTRAVPRRGTRVKMGWDATNLYILAELEEPDLWATLTERDAIVFHDNDFEVFIDPDGDTREYYEIEVNAIGTVFDLFLPKPYRAAGKADHSWTAAGMRCAIGLEGTLNDSRDTDRGWWVEMALPWTLFEPVASGGRSWQRAARPPRQGDQWRINFSRVQWTLEKQGSGYAKVSGHPEDNWTWTPQWIVDMHVPQRWGLVKFVKEQE
ncbi:MAG: carbohydrate-binding family 9-like protein [Phycisphaerales bacterium]|nr:carbohydrate-binding family 9-like protein [Phycisphaerales bacterium]